MAQIIVVTLKGKSNSLEKERTFANGIYAFPGLGVEVGSVSRKCIVPMHDDECIYTFSYL